MGNHTQRLPTTKRQGKPSKAFPTFGETNKKTEKNLRPEKTRNPRRSGTSSSSRKVEFRPQGFGWKNGIPFHGDRIFANKKETKREDPIHEILQTREVPIFPGKYSLPWAFLEMAGLPKSEEPTQSDQVCPNESGWTVWTPHSR